MSGRPGEDGFSLIEALVAMSIIAIAAVGLVRAAEAHVDSIRAIESRAAAQWVAENRLAELSVGPAAAGAQTVRMLNRDWIVTVAQRSTDDPDLGAVTVSVAPAGGAALVSLDGFVDRGTTSR